MNALLVVDAQNGFTELCPNELPVKGALEIVSEINRIRAMGFINVASGDAHVPSAPWITTNPELIASDIPGSAGKNYDLYWPAHCMAGTYGSRLIDGLGTPTEYDYFVWKGVDPDLHPYSCVYHDFSRRLSTGLIEYLRSRNVRNVIVTGLALDYCVTASALDLNDAGFNVILVYSATRSVAPYEAYETFVHSDASETLRRNGVTIVKDIQSLNEVLNEK